MSNWARIESCEFFRPSGPPSRPNISSKPIQRPFWSWAVLSDRTNRCRRLGLILYFPISPLLHHNFSTSVTGTILSENSIVTLIYFKVPKTCHTYIHLQSWCPYDSSMDRKVTSLAVYCNICMITRGHTCRKVVAHFCVSFLLSAKHRLSV